MRPRHVAKQRRDGEFHVENRFYRARKHQRADVAQFGKAGHDVTAYDIVTEKVERAAKTWLLRFGRAWMSFVRDLWQNRDGEIDFAAIVQMMWETGRS